MSIGAETSPTEQASKKLDASYRRYRQRQEKIKEEILNDASLPEVDRMILGVTGSPRELERWGGVIRLMGSLIGEPIVVVDRFENDSEAAQAVGGVINGEVKVGLLRGDETKCARLVVPTLQWFRWYRSDGAEDWREQNDLVITQFSSRLDMENGYESSHSPRDVLMGREAVRSSCLFNQSQNSLLPVLARQQDLATQ